MLIFEHMVLSKNSDNRKNVGFKICCFYCRGSDFDYQSIYIQLLSVILSCFGQIPGTSLKKPHYSFLPNKGKIFPANTMKANLGSRQKLHLFLTSALDTGEWLILSHGK
jgi:hypothetical protein